MLDRDLIQNAGVRNVHDGGAVTGFEFRLRMPNYGGVHGSLVDGVDVTVNGERLYREVTRWRLQGRDFTVQQLRRSTDVRWQLDETATITVPKPGGLTPGVHDLGVVIALHAPYIPAEFQPSLFPAQRKVTIVA